MEQTIAHRPRPPDESGRRARGHTGGAQLLDRRPRRIADGGHGPGARGAHPTGLVAPLEEVCLQPEAGSAICVQRFDDSLNSAIRTTYRISLRSSSLLMPRYPSTRVVYFGWSVAGTGSEDRRARKARRRCTHNSGDAMRGRRTSAHTRVCVRKRDTKGDCRSRVLHRRASGRRRDHPSRRGKGTRRHSTRTNGERRDDDSTQGCG